MKKSLLFFLLCFITVNAYAFRADIINSSGVVRTVSDTDPMPVIFSSGALSITSTAPTYQTNSDGTDTTLLTNGAAHSYLTNQDTNIAVSDVYDNHYDSILTVTATVVSVDLLSSYNDIVVTSDTDVVVSTTDATGVNGISLWEKSYIPIKDKQTIYIKNNGGGTANVSIHCEKK